MVTGFVHLVLLFSLTIRTSTIEREHKFDIHTDTNFVVPLDLVDPDIYSRPSRGMRLCG